MNAGLDDGLDDAGSDTITIHVDASVNGDGTRACIGMVFLGADGDEWGRSSSDVAMPMWVSYVEFTAICRAVVMAHRLGIGEWCVLSDCKKAVGMFNMIPSPKCPSHNIWLQAREIIGRKNRSRVQLIDRRENLAHSVAIDHLRSRR